MIGSSVVSESLSDEAFIHDCRMQCFWLGGHFWRENFRRVISTPFHHAIQTIVHNERESWEKLSGKFHVGDYKERTLNF
jgi:hypothetical protein